MSPTDRNDLRAKLLRMAEREPGVSPHGVLVNGPPVSSWCPVHDKPRKRHECPECFDALAAVALAQTSGNALLDSAVAADPPGEREADALVDQIEDEVRRWPTSAQAIRQYVLPLLTKLRAVLPAAAPAGGPSEVSALTEEQAGVIEAELRAIEADPEASKRALRLFMQSPMSCGHAAANLLTCSTPPFGCVICNALRAGAAAPSEDADLLYGAAKYIEDMVADLNFDVPEPERSQAAACRRVAAVLRVGAAAPREATK